MSEDVFHHMATLGHEELVFCHDKATGLRALIAIHSTVLGPALGGTRFKTYASETEAVTDALRLARGMTYKAAVAGLDLGGGKAVIIGDPKVVRSEALMRAYGRFVDGLGGRYITAEDVGTTQADMDLVRRETRWVTGIDPTNGGSGDPSPTTAFGVYSAMLAVAEHAFGSHSIEGLRVTVSGVGKVGASLVQHLVTNGAKVTIADVNTGAVEHLHRSLGVEFADPNEIHRVPADIFSPCALGAILTSQSIVELGARAICGAANNQLATPEIGDELNALGIVYAPDFVVNAGGIIHVADELRGFNASRVISKVREIGDTTARVLKLAAEHGICSAVAADRLAEERIETMAQVNRIRRAEP